MIEIVLVVVAMAAALAACELSDKIHARRSPTSGVPRPETQGLSEGSSFRPRSCDQLWDRPLVRRYHDAECQIDPLVNEDLS